MSSEAYREVSPYIFFRGKGASIYTLKCFFGGRLPITLRLPPSNYTQFLAGPERQLAEDTDRISPFLLPDSNAVIYDHERNHSHEFIVAVDENVVFVPY